jgi:RNA ligase (TIGR02306 family)
MRKLASIQKVASVKPIENSDFLEVLRVNGWDVVSKKGDFTEGDLCIYVEIDSFLPIREEFEFLRKTSYKKMGDLEGFRLRSIRLRGQVSQGLVLPINTLEQWAHLADDNFKTSYEPVGIDVTEDLGIIKYDPPIPAELNGVAKGNFPAFLVKTDEERIQNLSRKYEELKQKGPYVWTEKLEGTSGTFYFHEDTFGACSRKMDLEDVEGNTFWNLAREFNLPEILKSIGKSLCLQGEVIGPGIQGNIYKLQKPTVRLFNIRDIKTRTLYGIDEFLAFLEKYSLPSVPVVHYSRHLPDTVDELLELADGRSILHDTAREGIVLRSQDYSTSFKAVSNAYLVRQKD